MKEKKEKFFKSIKRRDPAARYALQILLTYPGVKAIIWYRVAHFFFSKLHLKLIGEMIAFITRKRTGIEIHPGCKIGRNLFIDHGMGVVIAKQPQSETTAPCITVLLLELLQTKRSMEEDTQQSAPTSC